MKSQPAQAKETPIQPATPYHLDGFSYEVLNSLTAHIAVIDREGTIVAVNDAWLKFAYESDGNVDQLSLGANYFKICRQAMNAADPGEAARALAGIETVMRDEVNEFELIYPCHGPHRQRWFLMRCTTMHQGNPHIIICHIDITERILATKALEKREQELEALSKINRQVGSELSLDATVHAILQEVHGSIEPDISMLFLLNGDTLILKDTFPQPPPAFDQEQTEHQIGTCLCGHAVKYGIPVYSYDLATDERCTLPECRAAGFHSFASIPFQDKGKVIGVMGLASSQPRDFSEHHSFLEAAAQDMSLSLKNALLYTKLHEYAVTMEQQLVARERLEHFIVHQQKLEAIGQLAGGIAHDFNNILSAIMGYTELSMEDSHMQESTHDHLEQVLTAAIRARDLIQQILTFSRKADNSLSPVDLRTIVTETLPLIKASLPSTITILNRSTLDTPVYINGNATQLQRLILNLCTNGMQAMETSEGILIIKVEIGEIEQELYELYPNLQKSTSYASLHVRDTGTGIAREHLKNIFTPYYSTKEPGIGTGLGLAVVHGIVKSHQAEIVVKSFLEHGTTVSIYFPLVAPPDPEQLLPPVDMQLNGTERILVVDDEESIVLILSQALTRLGYTVTACQNGAEALRLFQQEPEAFDLVLTDYTMPGLTGFQLAKEIKKSKPLLPVIVCTGHLHEHLYHQEYADATLRKPVTAQNIAKTIRELLKSP